MNLEALPAIRRDMEAQLQAGAAEAAFLRRHAIPFDVGPRGERSISFGVIEEIEADAGIIRAQLAEIDVLLSGSRRPKATRQPPA